MSNQVKSFNGVAIGNIKNINEYFFEDTKIPPLFVIFVNICGIEFD